MTLALKHWKPFIKLVDRNILVGNRVEFYFNGNWCELSMDKEPYLTFTDKLTGQRMGISHKNMIGMNSLYHNFRIVSGTKSIERQYKQIREAGDYNAALRRHNVTHSP